MWAHSLFIGGPELCIYNINLYTSLLIIGISIKCVLSGKDFLVPHTFSFQRIAAKILLQNLIWHRSEVLIL